MLERPLGAYRVIELPGPVPLFAGKLLADLGADVIKVEPPGGDEARFLPPLAPLGDGGDIGLLWVAYSLGKRSVTLDLHQEEGRHLFLRLLEGTDVLLDGFPPGELEGLGLGYERLQQANPRLVLTSISSFGQTGPYSRWRGSDLVHFALGGYLYMTGPEDGPPLKVSAPWQTLLFGGSHAVMATLLALRWRRQTGRGARVDQAIRDTVLWMLANTYQHYDLAGINVRRRGSARDLGSVVRLRAVYRCRDGYVVWMFVPGHIGGRDARALVQWMAKEGMAPDWFATVDWDDLDLLERRELLPELERAFADFFATKTKRELFRWAMEHRAMLAPMRTLGEVFQDEQLAEREAWRTVELGPGLPQARVPGPPVRLDGVRWEPRSRPPLPGEHNREIYVGELGLTEAELTALAERGVV
ncbi:Succinyl-CoA:(R)-benzylsuccinate CoA-transferase subunit BbsE [bacterium HR25]|jgi:crotonobetainyl-CoA:carnitine CoA-transferase CaiB-like acyl-CoA transferase|nr:Succinyl-CoA:(R)-benzylsuccinate CoA-transferase subunit BbsE [bacterium HR25]